MKKVSYDVSFDCFNHRQKLCYPFNESHNPRTLLKGHNCKFVFSDQVSCNGNSNEEVRQIKLIPNFGSY